MAYNYNTFGCKLCEIAQIPREEFRLGRQVCDDCTRVRNINPEMFDLLLKIFERRLQDEFDRHLESSYHAEEDY